MKRYCSMCGKMKKCDKAGHCLPCAENWKERKKQLRKEGFYKNMKKLMQPRYFNFSKDEDD